MTVRDIRIVRRLFQAFYTRPDKLGQHSKSLGKPEPWAKCGAWLRTQYFLRQTQRLVTVYLLRGSGVVSLDCAVGILRGSVMHRYEQSGIYSNGRPGN